MNSKDKENKWFQYDKFKQFFRLGRGNTEYVRGSSDLVITPDLEKELSQETSMPQRLKVIRELSENVISNRLEDQDVVERLLLATSDLLQPDQTKECRHTELLFIKNLIQGQYESLTLMRVHFFRIIKEHDHPEDTHHRIEILATLTDNGKDIKYFEDEIGKFMLQWMPALSTTELIQEFLSLLINIIKYNASYLYEEVISGFINNTCYLCCYSSSPQVVLGCLQVLDAVVCYSIFPSEALHVFVSALCRTVNVEQYCQTSWKIMRCILGTDLGHAALHVMCMALNSGDSDCALIRGAVFYLNMALWGPKRVPVLKCTPAQVLPSFLKALEGKQYVVTYEVILAMQSLISKHGQELHEPAWDLIFEIITAVIDQMDAAPSPYPLIVSHMHDTISSIEALHDNSQFNGNVGSLYRVIDVCGHSRPEASVLKLIKHISSKVVPTNQEWLVSLNHLVERYCRQETRVNIRLHVLTTLQTIVEQNRHCYEEELLDGVVCPNLLHCSTEADPVIRCASAKLLIELALHCHSKRFPDIFEILEKLLNRQFDLYVTNEAITLSEDTDISDVAAVANGMFRIFIDKLYKVPSQHAVRPYLAALHHLEMHYDKPSLFEHHPCIRLKLLEWFLSARANSMYHIGFPREQGEGVEYSPYLCVDSVEGSRPPHSPTPQPHNTQPHVSCVSIRRACRIMVVCLKQERDWSVLSAVLRELPNIMQNKALVLSKNTNDIDLLASALCNLVMDKNMPENLRNTNGKMTRSDFHACVLPVLSCLAPYHAHLDPQLQQKIIRYVTKFGLVSRCAQQCVTALTIFTLEMRDTMVKLLPEVLLDLSKISATVYIAVPILEFLSTLTRMPKVFASFVGDQYMSVFAILLPYTNPFKYNHYIVSLAHHVIAAWFLKCRLPFRKDFVKFIKHGLHNNMLKPFEEGKIRQDFVDMNQDSSNRKRSSSLTEQGSRRRDYSSRPTVGESSLQREVSDTFHIELTETCIDLMARYTYSPSISAPKRLHTAEFLLSGGQSMSWLVGHKIVTVTTSGCSQNPLRQGLCDRCLMLCKAHADSLQSPYSGGHPGMSGTESHRGSSEGLVPASGSDIKRQNSSENKGGEGVTNSPRGSVDADSPQPAQLSLKLESLASKQCSEDKSAGSGVGSRLERILQGNVGGSGGGISNLQCGCWCGGWAEVYVRTPTGDISWVMRIQNQVNIDSVWTEFPLSDISSLFLGGSGPSPLTSSNQSILQHLGSGASIASSGFADARSDVLSDGDPRSRSGSGGSQPDQIQKSSSDSVVTDSAPVLPLPQPSVAPPRSLITTGPINIPGSPQRQSSSGTNTDDDDSQINTNDNHTFLEDDQKCRHPVRRSNSSPDMSSSWKNPFHVRERMEAAEAQTKESTVTVVTSVEQPSEDNSSVSANVQQSKKTVMKSLTKDMRVSCEAIPEEMSGSTPPHPHLMTYKSDPGSAQAESQLVIQISSSSSSASEVNVSKVTFEKDDWKANRVSVPAAVSQEVRKCDGKPPHPYTPPIAPARSISEKTWSVGNSAVASGRSNSLLPTDTITNTQSQSNLHLDDLPPVSRSKRSNTISVMSPTRRRREHPSPKPKDWCFRYGASPAFVFLQLYSGTGLERPLLLTGSQHMRSVKTLDLVPPLETYRVGVLYVAKGQHDNETKILKNEFGSLRYAEFLQDLGTLISLEDAENMGLFLDVEKGGRDGRFAYVWQDDIMQVLFHVATLMPNSPSDPDCNEKRKHIGNDYVSIVYNESGEDFNIQTIKGHFNFACIIIEPLDHGTNKVTIKTKGELIEREFLNTTEPKIISDQNVALLARQLALHANLASLISRSLSNKATTPYASNWLERLRTIKRLRNKLLQERNSVQEVGPSYHIPTPLSSDSHNRLYMEDFTEYT